MPEAAGYIDSRFWRTRVLVTPESRSRSSFLASGIFLAGARIFAEWHFRQNRPHAARCAASLVLASGCGIWEIARPNRFAPIGSTATLPGCSSHDPRFDQPASESPAAKRRLGPGVGVLRRTSEYRERDKVRDHGRHRIIDL